MAQSAKFVDVTRSFLPVDPMAFPESMHGTAKEDAPESRIPVVAYQGHNFLPTSYGYKSYFGLNQDLGVDALNDRVDYVLAFQNEVFENFLIALAESGIWIKAGSVGGAWVKIVAIIAPVNPDVHFEWTYCIIADELYCYQQGNAQYHKIKSQAAAPGYLLTSVTPNFLNMPAQVGIFKAGGRLGFWDSADSIAWSNIDNLADFTPDIITLAGNILFTDVQGRIVTIRSHGEGFIIYASKSIVYVAQQASSTFDWDPLVILPNTGISYPQQCCVSQPDTIHFAYTNTGLFKIEKAQPGIIVPEVTDYLQEAEGPIYTRILEGRYLFLQLTDVDYINGIAEFKDEVVPEDSYFFPGGGKTIDEAVEAITIRGDSICNVVNGIDNADFDEQQPGGSQGGPAIPDKKPGTRAKPIWKCYISNNGVLDPADLTFGNIPCSVTDPNGVTTGMTPIGDSGRLDAMTQDSTKKTPLLGSDVYVDGIWTIERFIAVQSAIWNKQQANQNALVNKILSRAATGTKVSETGVCVAVPTAKTECIIGDYVTDYSGYQFGLSACQFWLTRWALAAITIKTIKANITNCDPVAAQDIIPTSWNNWIGTTTTDPQQACSTLHGNPAADYRPNTLPVNANFRNCYLNVVCTGSTGVIQRTPICPANFTPSAGPLTNSECSVPEVTSLCHRDAYYVKTEMMFAYNQAFFKDITPTPETAYCEIVGWSYTKVDGTSGTIAATACAAPKSFPNNLTPALRGILPADTDSSNIPVAPLTGSVCSEPFEPVTLPGIPSTSIDWPDTTVTIPEGSFLMQKGSIAPVYPDFVGALVYDLYLKKWGKFKSDYKVLLEYQPINDQSGGGIPYNTFGIKSGVFKSDGKAYLFDDKPSDSKIVYGKLGYYRLGMTSAEEIKIHFRTPSKGSITLETSVSGRLPAVGFSKTEEYDAVYEAQLEGGFPGRWHNIIIAGIYDIQYLEYRGFVQGRR